MASHPTVDGLYDSARRYARLALEAHAQGQYHLVALDAGTALEHLTKACLVQRSPVLIAELKNEGSIDSVLVLLGIRADAAHDAEPQTTTSAGATHLRTVGLRGALGRMHKLTPSNATTQEDWKNLLALADMRDGTVHAASNDQVEMTLMAAFAKYINVLLDDLRRDHKDFWGSRLSIVEALLTRARDSISYAVNIKLEAARVRFRRYREPLVLEAIRQVATAEPADLTAIYRECPICDSQGRAKGGFFGDQLPFTFIADSFKCSVCGLHLASPAEIEAAGMPAEWSMTII